MLAGLVSLLIVPILIKAYGITVFGLIVLARVLLPTGALAIFDFGFSEIAAQLVARARETGCWAETSRDVTLLMLIAGGVGITLASVVVIFAPFITDAFRIHVDYHQSFVMVVRATGLALTVIFPALVIEGIVKGFESYGVVRATELFGTLVYAVAAIIMAYNGIDYAVVAYAFLVSVLLRYMLLLFAAGYVSLRVPLRPQRIKIFSNIREVLYRCRQMASSRVIGVLQSQAQTPLLGVVLGPSAVGLYDVLTRLPRFAKSVVGMLSSALLPVAVRIDAINDASQMRRFGSWGLMISGVVAIPPLATGALFSEPLLRLWIGSSVSGLWGWHAAMFVIPALGAITSVGATSLFVRPAALTRLNYAMLVQVVLQYALSFAFVNLLDERAFMLGQSVAIILTFPWLLFIIVHEQQLAAGEMNRLLFKLGLLGAIFAASYWLIFSPYTISGWLSLALHACTWSLAYWVAIWLLILKEPQRHRLVEFISGSGRQRSQGSVT